MNNNILSLLGLALRGGRLAVGEEPAALAAKAGQARLLLAASDAAGNTLRRAEHLAGQGHCLWLVLPFTKAELGGALGRGSAALAALTDTGLAAALTERLAVLDPERYGETAQRMELKRRRAKERQSAPHRAPPEDRRKPRRDAEGPPRRKADARTQHGGRNGGRPAKPGRGGKPGEGRPGRAERPGGDRGGKRRPDGGGRPPSGKRGEGRPPYGRPGEGRFRGGKRPGPGKGRPPKDGRGGGR